MKSILSFSTILLFCCIPFIGWAQNEQERILNFDVEIKMNENRSIDVYEKIEVYSLGNKIKRGITRGLPTRRYIEDQKYIVKYQDLTIHRDGKVEPFHSKSVEDGKMLYVGQSDFFLPNGKHIYEIRYSVPNQTEWLDEFDRLRWNAIGTDISFETERARIRITMPENASLKSLDTYVGEFGSTDPSRIVRSQEGQSVSFSVEGGLRAGEGITTSLQLEKGTILQPSLLEKSGSLISILMASALLFFYFLYTWFRYGIDPKPTQSGLLYSTPEQLSPASINYISTGKYEERSMTSSIISLAIKGFINITENANSGSYAQYEIRRLKDTNSELPPEEYSLMNHLFSSHSVFTLDGKFNSRIKKMNQAHEKAIRDQHEVFVKEGNNLKFILLPILIIILTIALSFILSLTFGLGSLIVWKQLLIFVPIALIGLVVYRYLIIQPTLEKVNLLSDIEGFKEYIQLNLEDRENLESAPNIDVQHFESILPHAFALGLEKNWYHLFEDYLITASYVPEWTGNEFMVGTHFHSRFSRQMERATYDPTANDRSFSSGSGGGGFSGGGGGGGSVGGW